MKWMTTFLLAAAAATSACAWSGSTKDFLDRCERDEAWCAREIGETRQAIERGPGAQKRICLPPGLKQEGLVFEVTYWIGEQIPSMDHRPHAESIAAALVSLYACDRPKGQES